MIQHREIKREIDTCETCLCPGYESSVLCYYERDKNTGKKLLELPLFCLGFSSDYEIVQGIKELAEWIKDRETLLELLDKMIEFLKKRHE
jgi:hypothetical protein